MKTIHSLTLLLLIVVSSCMDSSAPRPVAEKFLEAMQERDYEEAAGYGTKETGKLLQQLERIEALQPGDQRPSMGKITIVSEEIHGKTATVYFTEEGVAEEQKISLQKFTETDGSGKEIKVWKVALRKEELQLPVVPETE